LKSPGCLATISTPPSGQTFFSSSV